MSLSSWRERAKLGGLVLVVLLCLSTLWATFSFGMGQRDVPHFQVRQASLILWCDPYQQKLFPTCQRAVKHAFKWMNLSGTCLQKEQHVVLCELEWCISSAIATTSAARCKTECDNVRTNLQNCIDRQVQVSLRSFGLPPETTTTAATRTTNHGDPPRI